jgi:hypothetical protein
VFSQSKTLPQAVAEYTRRYDRAPPKGFEEWWQFCKRNQVKIVDDVSGSGVFSKATVVSRR